jgi:NitT/TauT family transport system substrate-binding protein
MSRAKNLFILSANDAGASTLRVRRSARKFSAISMISVMLIMLLAACGGDTGNSGGLQKVSIGLGYQPDIQFSPFYVAQSKGYYKAAGLDVSINYGDSSAQMIAMSAGKNTFTFVGGDELLQARSSKEKLQAISVGTVFQQYPVSLIVPVDSTIKHLEDLKGHTIGVPLLAGSTYTGLLALLYKAGLTTNDVKIQPIGFTQVQSLLEHKVDAVMGYSNNEPLQLRKRGMSVSTFAVSDYQPLVSNGIVVMADMYNKQSKLVNDFVQATLKAVKDVIDDPDGAVTITKKFVSNLDAQQAREVLMATIPLWQSKGELGYNDPEAWESMRQFMVAQKMIPSDLDVKQAYTNKAVQAS